MKNNNNKHLKTNERARPNKIMKSNPTNTNSQSSLLPDQHVTAPPHRTTTATTATTKTMDFTALPDTTTTNEPWMQCYSISTHTYLVYS
jgi:hypothetical protein